MQNVKLIISLALGLLLGAGCSKSTQTDAALVGVLAAAPAATSSATPKATAPGGTCQVSGSVGYITGETRAGQQVQFANLDTPAMNGPTAVLPSPVTTTTDNQGKYTANLIPGHYRMSVNGIPCLFLNVPNSSTLVINQNTPGIQAVFISNTTPIPPPTNTASGFIYGLISPGMVPLATATNTIANSFLHQSQTNMLKIEGSIDVRDQMYIRDTNGLRYQLIAKSNGQVLVVAAPDTNTMARAEEEKK